MSLLDTANPVGTGQLRVPPIATGKSDTGFGRVFPISPEVPGSRAVYAEEHEIQLLESLCCETGVRRHSSPEGLHWGPYTAPGEPGTADADPGLLQKSHVAQCAFLLFVIAAVFWCCLPSALHRVCLTCSETILWFRSKLLLTLMLFPFPVH